MRNLTHFLAQRFRHMPGGSILLVLLAMPLTQANAQQADTLLPGQKIYILNLDERDTDGTRPAVGAETIAITKKRYDRILKIEQRRAQKGYWQFNGSLGIGVPYLWYGSGGTFTRDVSSSSGYTETFILPSGEIVEAARQYNGSYGDQLSKGFNSYTRAGIGRQTRWGGYFHATSGYYRARTKATGDIFEELNRGEIQTLTTSKEDVLTSELGFQYTFFRNRRFRPYFGISLLNFMYYHGEEVAKFYDADTRQTGVIRGFKSTEYMPLYTEVSFTIGFQFEVSDRLSLGAHLYANGASNIFIDAPVGLEARYSLK